MSAQRIAETFGVPFLDLSCSHAALKEPLLDDIADLLDTGAFTNGPAVAEFEQAFAEYCGVDHCVGVSSGLDALRLGLLASGIEPGDEVVVPAATFVATLEAVTQAGGIPVVVDVTERDYCLDPRAAAAAVGPRTHALMPVHLYGQMADMHALLPVADARGLVILEDACQAHGAERAGLRAGAAGTGAAFSFYPGKNLGAAGDAGAFVTGDAEAAAPVRALREHGQTAKYVHAHEGWTARLDTIQAVVLSHKLPLLDDWNAQRRVAARFYGEALAGVGDLVLPPTPAESAPVWHLYVIRTADPESLALFLRERGIGTGRHYPHPVHLTAAYARSATAPATSRSRRRLPARVPIVADLPRHLGGSTRGGRRRGARATSMAERPSNDAPYRLIDDVLFGEGVIVSSFTNLYGCTIGAGTRVGPFVEIQRGAVDRRTAARSRATPSSVTARTSATRCSSGHGVVFINDKRPRATTEDRTLQTNDDWELVPTLGRRSRLDRLGCGDHGRSADRCRSARGRGRRGDPRRRRRRHGRRRSGPGACRTPRILRVREPRRRHACAARRRPASSQSCSDRLQHRVDHRRRGRYEMHGRGLSAEEGLTRVCATSASRRHTLLRCG